MGRACDCCGDDDVFCDRGNFCLSCYGEGCSDISEIDIEDTISIIVLNHNIDDKTKNACYSDDCDFVDARYDIYIGPDFSLAGQITDNSILNNKKDELKYSTKIGTTAPFRDSSSCSDFDPVCKCITPQYFKSSSGGVDYDGTKYSRTKPCLTDELTDDLFGSYDLLIDEETGEPIEGYIVRCNVSLSYCDSIGGQFIFEENPEDCNCTPPTPQIIEAAYVADVGSYSPCDSTDYDLIESELEQYIPVKNEENCLEYVYTLNEDASDFSIRIDLIERLSEVEADYNWSQEEADDFFVGQLGYTVNTSPYGFPPYKYYAIPGTCSTDGSLVPDRFDDGNISLYNTKSNFWFEPTDDEPLELGWYAFDIPSTYQVAEVNAPKRNELDADAIADAVEEFVNSVRKTKDISIFGKGCDIYNYNMYIDGTRRWWRNDKCNENYTNYTAYDVVGGGGGISGGGNQNFKPDISQGRPDPIYPDETEYRVAIYKPVYEKVPNNTLFQYGDGIEVVDTIVGSFDEYRIEITPYVHKNGIESAVDVEVDYIQYCTNCYFSNDFIGIATKIPDELSQTFDPSIEPEIPGQSRTKVSVTIAATSEKIVEYLRKVINDQAYVKDCQGDLCGNIRRYAENLVGSIDLKEEIKYALDNEDEDGNNPNIIIYDKQIIQDINTENCDTLPYLDDQDYYWRPVQGSNPLEYERVPSPSTAIKLKATRLGVGVYLSSDSVFNGKVFAYNGVIKTYDQGLVFFRENYNSDDFYTSKKMRDLYIRYSYYRNPSEYYECDSCTFEELKDLEAEYRQQFKGFKLLKQCALNVCCTLQENIGEYKLKIIRPELDYEGKEPALYKHYYVINDYSFNNTANPFYSYEVKLPDIQPIKYNINIFSDGGQEYSCSFTSDALDGQYLGTGTEGLVDCFNPENEYCKSLLLLPILSSFYLSGSGQLNAVGLTSARYTYFRDNRYNMSYWKIYNLPLYLLDDEELRPDCLYDLRLYSPRPDNTTCYTCFATQYLATFEEYDGVGEGDIISGTMYGNVVSNVISDNPYIYKGGNQCMWYLPCTPYPSHATVNQIRCGGLYADGACGVIGTQLSSLELPIFKSIPDPASDCLLTQQIGTYTHYHSEAGSTSYEMDGYCNPEQDYSNCKNSPALKKTTTTEWLEKSMGRACGGMMSLPYTSLETVCQNEDQLWKWEISPDPRERYNRDIYAFRLKYAEYKSGELELDFSKAQEMQDGDGNTFFYIQGESIGSFFDTSKIDMGNAVELIQDKYQELISTYSNQNLRIIGDDVVELGTGLELRYSFIGNSQIKLQLIYPAFLQGYSVDYIGKSLDLFGSRRCVDDCCTEYEYDPPSVAFTDPYTGSSCGYGGEGVDGSIKNAEGYNTGFSYWRRTAFFSAAAATVPDSYNINDITMRVIQVVVDCVRFESLDDIEALISSSAYDQSTSFFITGGPRILSVSSQIRLPIPFSCYPTALVPSDHVEGNELCPAAATNWGSLRTFTTQASLINNYTLIQTELIKDE